MKIPPWNFSSRGAWAGPQQQQEPDGPSQAPPKKRVHGATKGIPAQKKKKKKKRLKTTKKTAGKKKTPNPLRSPLPRVKLKIKKGPDPPTPTPGGHLGKGEKPCAPGGNLRTEIPRGVRGFRYRLGLCLTQM